MNLGWSNYLVIVIFTSCSELKIYFFCGHVCYTWWPLCPSTRSSDQHKRGFSLSSKLNRESKGRILQNYRTMAHCRIQWLRKSRFFWRVTLWYKNKGWIQIKQTNNKFVVSSSFPYFFFYFVIFMSLFIFFYFLSFSSSFLFSFLLIFLTHTRSGKVLPHKLYSNATLS